MRADFYRTEEPDLVIGTAEWDGRAAVVSAGGDEARRSLERIFRPTAVQTDRPTSGAAGSRAEAVVEPGSLEWFRTAALVRGAQAGFGVRFVTDSPGGWDPALDPQAYGWAGEKPALPHER